MSSAADATPPSPPLPVWATAMQREIRDLKKIQQEQHKAHKALESKQAADTIAHIHLLAQIADSVTAVSVDVTKLNKQIWGAIKQLRKKR